MNTFESIIKRKSVRSFNETPITKEEIDKLIHAAKAAPISGGGFADSDRHISVVQNRKVLDELSKGIIKLGLMANQNQTPLYNASTLLVFSAPKNRFDAQQLDVALSAQNASIVASSMGLNSLIMSGPAYALNSDIALKQSLNIPLGFTPYIAIAIGHTDDNSIKEREFNNHNVEYIL